MRIDRGAGIVSPRRAIVIGAVSAAAAVTRVAAQPSAAADDAVAGQSLCQAKCAPCHAVDADRLGPSHRNVAGRAVARVPSCDCSPALKKLGGIWTEGRLDRFLSGPQKLAPWSRMYLALDDPAQRRVIIACLRSVSTAAPKT